jgi:nicotinate-nucleotide pyrophosphorylase
VTQTATADQIEELEDVESHCPRVVHHVAMAGENSFDIACKIDPQEITNALDQARREIERRGLKTEILADGGIRRETVPLIAAAGADYIVPGSLMFKEDPATMRTWLATL